MKAVCFQPCSFLLNFPIQAMPTIRHCLKKGAKSVVLWRVLRTPLCSFRVFWVLISTTFQILSDDQVHTWADQTAKSWSASKMFGSLELLDELLDVIYVQFIWHWNSTFLPCTSYRFLLTYFSKSSSARKYSLAPVAKAVETCFGRICHNKSATKLKMKL